MLGRKTKGLDTSVRRYDGALDLLRSISPHYKSLEMRIHRLVTV